MLTTLSYVLNLPGLNNPLFSTAFLTQELAAADAAIKNFVKRDLELTQYQEFYSGTGKQDLVLKQWPVQLTPVPQVFVDQQGFAGQGINSPFAPQTQLTLGTQFMLALDAGGLQSTRGTLRKIGGDSSFGFSGWWGYPEVQGGRSKLAASYAPSWPMGEGNIKVIYTAGYATIPADLQYAEAMLVAWMVRNQPVGAKLQSESMENYSYSLASAAAGGIPELGEIVQTLKTYREVAL